MLFTTLLCFPLMCNAFVLEAFGITSLAMAMSQWPLLIGFYNFSKKEEPKIESTELSIYREQFEIGYTSYLKKTLNYLLHLSHDELLVSLTVILTILSLIVLYYSYKFIKYFCCYNKPKEIRYINIYGPKQLNYGN